VKIGRTPLVRLRLPGVRETIEIWGKCEWANPGGSVKDRTALSLITEGEKSGALRPGKTIIDSSSGNTAVGLALVGRNRGYAVELVMPSSASPDRQRRCEAYGAKITLTDAFSGSDGAILKVRELVAAEPEKYFYADQYRNPANPLAHYRTTGPEIWEETGGRITHFVAGLGTSGTVMGTGRYLREKNPAVRIVAVEPDEALHGLEGLKHMASAIVPEIYERSGHDEVVPVSTEAACALRRECREALDFDVGNSAAAALVAARMLAQRLDSGVVVVLLPDRGEPEACGEGGRLRIPRAQAEAIVAHALEGYPFEACGVFLGNGDAVTRAERVPNRETETPRVRYQIAPEDLIRIQREARAQGLEIVGYYHSHPDHPARPSETDRRVAAEGLSDGVFHVVIGVSEGRQGTPTAWVFRDRDHAFLPVAFEVE